MKIKRTVQKAKLLRRRLEVITHMLVLIILRYIVLYSYIGIVSVGGILLWTNNFLSKTSDTTTLTNIAFAIFAVIANICFSWSKIFPNDSSEYKTISFQGERLLIGGLSFLVASFMKYLYLQKPHFPQGFYTSIVDVFFQFIFIFFYIAFIYAYIMATGGIFYLFVLLFRRHIKMPDLSILEENTASNT